MAEGFELLRSYIAVEVTGLEAAVSELNQGVVAAEQFDSALSGLNLTPLTLETDDTVSNLNKSKLAAEDFKASIGEIDTDPLVIDAKTNFDNALTGDPKANIEAGILKQLAGAQKALDRSTLAKEFTDSITPRKGFLGNLTPEARQVGQDVGAEFVETFLAQLTGLQERAVGGVIRPLFKSFGGGGGGFQFFQADEKQFQGVVDAAEDSLTVIPKIGPRVGVEFAEEFTESAENHLGTVGPRLASRISGPLGSGLAATLGPIVAAGIAGAVSFTALKNQMNREARVLSESFELVLERGGQSAADNFLRQFESRFGGLELEDEIRQSQDAIARLGEGGFSDDKILREFDAIAALTLDNRNNFDDLARSYSRIATGSKNLANDVRDLKQAMSPEVYDMFAQALGETTTSLDEMIETRDPRLFTVIGDSAEEASSVLNRVTEKFPELTQNMRRAQKEGRGLFSTIADTVGQPFRLANEYAGVTQALRDARGFAVDVLLINKRLIDNIELFLNRSETLRENLKFVFGKATGTSVFGEARNLLKGETGTQKLLIEASRAVTPLQQRDPTTRDLKTAIEANTAELRKGTRFADPALPAARGEAPQRRPTDED